MFARRRLLRALLQQYQFIGMTSILNFLSSQNVVYP
jgi:hypothetical protein